MSSTDATQRLQAICAEVGFDLQLAASAVVARLALLAEYSETVRDAERMVERARTVFRHYEETKPAQGFGELERRIVVLGCLFSDIGKTGPANADASAQRLIVEMFAVEGVRDDAQPVSQFLTTYFLADSGERIQRFATLGLDPRVPLRAFWNLHSTWTLQIVKESGVPVEAIAAAAAHHFLDDINPESIVGLDGRFTRSFGENATFDRAEKLIILLDKYDAVRRRGRGSHEQAITWLKDRVEKHPHFHGDVEFRTLIADLDAVAQA